jgi:preprotein translocase subunit YajC
VDTVAPFLILLGIALLFWFAIIRPQQRRQRALNQLQGALRVGDEVMLTSGIIGQVRALDEETVQLEVSEGVTLRVVRAAVGHIRNSPARDDGTETDAAGEPEET